MPEFSINWWAVLIAVVINMVVGSLWYSPMLFGKQWAKLINKKMDEMTGDNSAMVTMVVVAIALTVVLAVAMDLFRVTTYIRGAIMGFFLWVIYALTSLPDYIFTKRPLGLYFLNVGYNLVTYVAGGAVLGGMQ